MDKIPQFGGVSRWAVILIALGLTSVPLSSLAADASCSKSAQACTVHASAPVVPTSTLTARPTPLKTTPSFHVPAQYARAARTISALGNGQAQILKAFTTPLGLYGFTVQLGHVATHDVLVYVTPNGHYFIFGGIFTASGRNLSRVYAQKYLPAAATAPKVQTNSAQSLIKSIAHTTWFTVGRPDAPKHIWFLFDPNCIFCHLTWDKFLPYVKSGQLSIRAVPVGFLKPGSAKKAAAILLDKDPAQALTFNEAHFNAATEEGGIHIPSHIPPSILAEVHANNAWMQSAGIAGTPLLLWHGPHGHAHRQDGMPLSISTFIKEVG